jgi:epoxyqueuosine reductase
MIIIVIDKTWFLEKIKKFLSEDDSNKIKVDGSLIYDPEVLVGFVSGNDPIFEKYKDIIGSFHLTPAEAYSKYCERNKISCSTENLSVLAYILPISKETKK